MTTTVLGSHILFAIMLFAFSVVATFVVLKLKILDEPNQRSSHDRPTPSTGGMAIFATCACGFTVVWFVGDEVRLSKQNLIGFAVAACVISVIGLFDDLKKLKTFQIKLLGQIAAAMVLLASGIVFSQVPLPFVGQIQLGWVGYPLTVIWLVAMTNIFNFMDGLNGLAGGVAVAVAAFLCAVTYLEGSFFVYILCYILVASSAGFLVYNFPRPRLFMGDVGSQFLGFSFAAIAIIAAEIDTSRTSLLVVPLLFFNFIFDTVFTLCRRLLNGENITQAHRGHLYQLLNQIGWSHVRVSILHFFMTISQGVGTLILIRCEPQQQVVVFLPFLILQTVYAVLVIGGARRMGILHSPIRS